MSLRYRWSAFFGLPGLMLAAGLVALPYDAFAQQGGWTGNVNVFLGVKALDEDDWEPAEGQGEFAVELDLRPRTWPVNMVLGLRGAAGEGDIEGTGVTLESTTSELSFGLRKIWEPTGTPVRPFIGGGLSSIRAEATFTDGFSSTSDSDSGVGFWVGGGVYFTLGEHFNLGLDLRVSRADVEVFDLDLEAGGTHFGVLLGYHW